MAVAKKIKLGQAVTYISTKGYEKLAFVVGTPESIQEGHAIEKPQEGFAHLLVFSFAHGFAPRVSVPSEAAAADIADYQTEDGPRGVFRV